MKKPLALSISSIVCLTVIAPLITMCFISLCSEPYPRFPWPGWSIRWYVGMFQDVELLTSIRRSALVGLSAAAVGTVIGFTGGYPLSRLRLRNMSTILSLAAVPSLIPMVVFGLCFLRLADSLGIARGSLMTVIAHTTIFSPVAVYLFYQACKRLNLEVEEAARELGASEPEVALRVVLPQIWSAAIASIILIFVLSWDEHVISWFVSGFQKTYPIYVSNMLQSTMTPEIDAAGTLTAVFSIALIGVAWRLLRTVV